MPVFNTIPGNIVAPIFTFEINSGGQFENAVRLLLIGHKIAAGSAALDVPVMCSSTLEARQMFGAGSMLDDMMRLARRNAPAQEIWCLPATETGTAEVRTITVNSVPAAGGYGVIEIAGEPIGVTIAAGDTADIAASALNAAIAAYWNPLTEASLPYTSSVAGAVVTLTTRHKGLTLSDIDIAVPVLTGANAFTGNVTFATTTAGVGSPDLSAGLAALGDDAFDWIVSPFADATNVGRYKALLSDVAGRWAWNRQVYGHVFYPQTDTVANLTTAGLAQDNRHLSMIPRPATGSIPQPSWQWVAAIAARIAPWLADGSTGNVSRNQTGLSVEGISPPRDRSKWYGYATRDAFLRSGISTWSVDQSGRVLIDKIITMQRTTLGAPDTTFRDIQKIGQLVYALRKFRTDLMFEHGQKAIANDNPGNVQSVSTPRDIAATFMHSYQSMVLTGVLENADEAAKQLRVERNADNPNRVDIYAPIDMVNPLDIVAANAVVYSQFRQAA
jgi:phage tail sheath gpL-like